MTVQERVVVQLGAVLPDRSDVLRRILMDVANELRERGALDEEDCFIDATRDGQVQRRGDRSDQARKRMKIMAIVDRHGLPLSVSTPAAGPVMLRLLHDRNLIGDRAYDSDPLDET
jgi:hypothetical protein